jgi:hypothetical protein
MVKKLITFIYYIPNVSSQSSRATVTFQDKFYIIWNLDFNQVYILDLPLLLTPKKYLN